MATHPRRRTSSAVDSCVQRRRRYETVLRPLGLWQAFARMPRKAQEAFCQRKFPDPVLEFDAAFPSDPDYRGLRKRLQAAFQRASLPIDGAEVPVRDFFSVIAGLKHTIQDSLKATGLPSECVRFMQEASPLLEKWYEPNIPEAWGPLHAAVVHLLLAQSRLDGRLFWASVKQEFTPHGKYLIRMTVHAGEPQQCRVELNGASRPVYRVGSTNEWDGVRWLSWDGGQRGQCGLMRGDTPVYVQSHALRQLRERANVPTMAPFLEYWLYHSLAEPRVAERQGEDLLVEYCVDTFRIGYLVVTPLADRAVVRTFKFLTMEGTPEARLLQRQLRLTRRDVDWLGLHELAAFTQTDLRRDPQLRSLLDACGCGHLFALGEGNYAPTSKAFAAEMRRYLRMAA